MTDAGDMNGTAEHTESAAVAEPESKLKTPVEEVEANDDNVEQEKKSDSVLETNDKSEAEVVAENIEAKSEAVKETENSEPPILSQPTALPLLPPEKSPVIEHFSANGVTLANVTKPVPSTRSNSGNEDMLTIDEGITPEPETKTTPIDSEPVMKPISVDTSISAKDPIASVTTRNSVSRVSASKTAPKSAPADSIASSRSKRPRVPVRHFEFEDVVEEPEPPEQPISLPSSQTSTKNSAPKIVKGKKASSASTTPKEAMFDKGDYCTVRSDLVGENFYLCLLCQDVYENSKALIPIRWLEIEKTPNQYKWSFPDKIDKGCILTNVSVESLGKDRIILPNSEIMRSIYVLKKSIQSEKGEKVTLELPPKTAEGKEEAPEMVAETKKATNKRGGGKAQSSQKTPTALKRTREPSISSTESSEQFSDLSDEYVVPQSRRRGGARGGSSATVTRQGSGRTTTRNQTSGPTSAKQPSRGHQLELDEDYNPSVERKTRGSNRITPTKAVSPGNSGFDPDKTLSPTKSPVRTVNYTSRIKIDPNDQFLDEKYIFDETDLNFKAKQIIRLVSFGDLDLIKRALSDPKLDSVCCGRSKDCLDGPFETAAQNDDVTSLLLLLDKNMELAKKAFTSSCLLKDKLLTEDINLKCRSFPYDNFFEELMRTEPEPFKLIDFLVSKGYIETLIKFVHLALKNGNQKSALHVLKVGNSTNNENILNVLDEFNESKLEPILELASYQQSLGLYLIHAAAASENGRYLSQLLDRNQELINVCDCYGWYCFHYAAACKSATNIDILCNRIGNVINSYVTSDSGLTPLMIACQLNRVKNVQTLLNVAGSIQQQKLLETANFDGKTCLHLAAEAGNVEVLNMILPLCFDVNVKTGTKHGDMTALMLTASKGHFKSCEILLNKKCDVNVEDVKGRTALTFAILNGFQNIVSLLICSGAVPTKVDINGNSLVHYATCYGWSHCLTLLIDIGLSLSLPVNNQGFSPMFCAVMKGNFSLATKLLYSKEVDINARCTVQHRTILQHVVASSGPFSQIKDTVSFLVKLSVKPNCKLVDSKNLSVVNILAERANLRNEEKEISVEIAKILFDCGADLNMCLGTVDPPFLAALKSDNVPLAKFILDNSRLLLSGGELDNGINVLHLILQHACVSNVDELLLKIPSGLCCSEDFAKNAPSSAKTPLTELLSSLETHVINREKFNQGLKTLTQLLVTFSKCNLLSGKAGIEALHQACKMASKVEPAQALGLVRTLLDEGSDPKETLDGANALHVALLHSCQLPIVELIASKISEFNVPLISTSGSGNLYKGFTPIMLACKNERPDLVQFLLSNSVNLEMLSIDDRKRSLLHITVENVTSVNGLSCLEKILSKVSNLDAVDSMGDSALHYAVRLNLAVVVDTCKMLLKAGVSAKLQNSEGQTALHSLFTSKRDSSVESSSAITTFDPLELLLLFLENSSASFAPLDDKGCTAMHYIAAKGASLCAQVIKDLDISHPPDKNGNTVLCHALINRKEDCAIGILNSDLNLDLTKLYVYIPTSFVRNTEINDFQDHSEGSRKISAFSLIAHLNMWRLFFLAVKRFASSATNSFFLSQIIRSGQMSAASIFLNNMHPDSLTVAENNLNHFHDLSLAYFELSDEIEAAGLVEQLYAKSVKAMNPDKPNSVLCFHYAAYTANLPLLKVLYKVLDCDKVAFAKDDFCRTVFAASLMSGNLEAVKFCFEKFSTPKLNDIIIRFGKIRPTSESIYESYNSASDVIQCTPLIYAIHCIQDAEILRFLVSTGLFDLNKSDENKKTPIMYAIGTGQTDKVECLLYPDTKLFDAKEPVSSKIDLSTLDEAGNSIGHYTVFAAVNHGVQNEKNVDMLINNEVKFDDVAAAGKSAYELAVDNKYYKLATKMAANCSRISMHDLNPLEPTLPSSPTAPEDQLPELNTFDVEALSAELFTKFNLSLERLDYVAEVDKNVGNSVGSKAEVVMDDKTPMDARLVRVETGEPPNPRSVSFHYFKMQLVHAKNKNGYYLHINSGEVGSPEPSQVQSQPIQSLEQAKREFSKLFKSKTDNSWESHRDRKFTLRPRKYTVLKTDYSRKVKKPALSSELSDVYCLPKSSSDVNDSNAEVSTFLNSLLAQTSASFKFLKEFGSNFSDGEIILGATSKDMIERLKAELLSMQTLVEEVDLELSLRNPNWGKVLITSHKMNTLSNEIYYSLPLNFDACLTQPFYTKKGIKILASIVDTLQSFHLYSQIWFANRAKFNLEPIQPSTFMSSALLPVNLRILSDVNPVHQLIAESLKRTSVNLNGVKMFEVLAKNGLSTAQSETGKEIVSNFQDFENHFLLWLQMPSQNIVSILFEGVRPIIAQQPFRFANSCVQFTDYLAQALEEAETTAVNNYVYLTLCHVNLGRIYEQPEKTSYHDFTMPSNVQSVYFSDMCTEKFEVAEKTIPGGVRFRDLRRKNGTSENIGRSDYAVFDKNRVKLAYVIQVKLS